jgi:hypothetical protein
MHTHLLMLTLLAAPMCAQASVSVTVDVAVDNVAISPYIYGRNGGSSDQKDKPNTEADLVQLRESGVRFLRQNNGNNCTNYNWRKKLTCHPDWYNNVYGCDWDLSAKTISDELPGVMAMYGFQMAGRVAKSDTYNFDAWGYNKCAWGDWCSQNLCGNGVAASSGTKAATEGDTSLYTQAWPADSSVAIYSHWKNDLGLNMDQFKYWNMDNEMEIWCSTHDDIIKTFDAEDVMQKYFATAKAIRAINPNVKLSGPVCSSEWFWYSTPNGLPTYNGKKYCWLEYFIMRCAEEQKATGIRMLDVLDLHDYPSETGIDDILQTHRVFFDTTYVYPGANGVKTVNGGWDNIDKEYVFVRCQQWIDKYFGANSGITFGVSEYNVQDKSTMANTLAYASMLGEFGRHGVEYFTPWTWKVGMWETLHLFSRYGHSTEVGSKSSDEVTVSAYPTVNANRDSMTVILVNRSQTAAQTVDMTIDNFKVADGDYVTEQLANLSTTETFVSHTNNALQQGSVTVKSNALTATVPAMSITAVVLKKATSGVDEVSAQPLAVYPNPASGFFFVPNAEDDLQRVELVNANGQTVLSQAVNGAGNVRIDVSSVSKGVYVVRANTANESRVNTIVIK